MIRQSTTRRRRGAAALEFALVFPFVFGLFFAFVEHGRYTMVMDLLQNAAREGGRFAAVSTTDSSITDEDVIAWVDQWMAGQNATLDGYNVTVFRTNSTGANLGTWKNSQYGQLIAVRIQGTHTVWLPLLTLLPPTIELDVRAICVAEAN